MFHLADFGSRPHTLLHLLEFSRYYTWISQNHLYPSYDTGLFGIMFRFVPKDNTIILKNIIPLGSFVAVFIKFKIPSSRVIYQSHIAAQIIICKCVDPLICLFEKFISTHLYYEFCVLVIIDTTEV